MDVLVIERDTSLFIADPKDDWVADFKQQFGFSTSDITYYLVYWDVENKYWWGDGRCFEM